MEDRISVRVNSDAVKKAVLATLAERNKSLGDESHEADFLCGAMVVLNEIFPHPEGPGSMTDIIPANWVFGPMMGRSVIS